MNFSIEWVNHASYVIRTKNVTLITDPWIEGRVFNESWELLLKTKFSYNDFKDVTHIWFSHEHPDHFYPPNLKNIPLEYRSKITVLFHESIDKKVIEFCSKIGFGKIVELQDFRKVFLNEEFSIICSRVENDTDSWLFSEVNGFKILNLNDCVFSNNEKLKKIKDKLPRVDLLLTQFSYANWCGNVIDKFERENKASQKIEEVLYRVNLFQPTYFIPFASYVWFCHQDNFYFNDSINKIDELYERLKGVFKSTKIIVLKPGDKLNIEDLNFYDSSNSLKLYQAAYNEIKSRNKTLPKKVSIENLLESAINYKSRLLRFHNSSKLYKTNPINIFVKDYEKCFQFSFYKGLIPILLEEEYCDISMTSDVLLFTFNTNWGFDTLLVSGLFQKPNKGNFSNVKYYVFLAELINKGERIGGVFSSLYRIFKSYLR